MFHESALLTPGPVPAQIVEYVSTNLLEVFGSAERSLVQSMRHRFRLHRALRFASVVRYISIII